MLRALVNKSKGTLVLSNGQSLLCLKRVFPRLWRHQSVECCGKMFGSTDWDANETRVHTGRFLERSGEISFHSSRLEQKSSSLYFPFQFFVMLRHHVSVLIHQRSWKFGSKGQARHLVEKGLYIRHGKFRKFWPKDSSSHHYSLRCVTLDNIWQMKWRVKRVSLFDLIEYLSILVYS